MNKSIKFNYFPQVIELGTVLGTKICKSVVSSLMAKKYVFIKTLLETAANANSQREVQIKYYVCWVVRWLGKGIIILSCRDEKKFHE